MFTRRTFIATAACTMAAARLPARDQSTVRIALSIPSEATGRHMASDFLGLSYEVHQLADASFFSSQNSGLIRAFKALSSLGVLRLGGNTSEFAYWKPTASSPEPEHPKVREVIGEPKAQYYAELRSTNAQSPGFWRKAKIRHRGQCGLFKTDHFQRVSAAYSAVRK